MNSTRFLSGLLLSGLVLVGCSGSAESQYLSADETNADYIEASQSLQLPDGIKFEPPANIAVAEDGNEILYEEGSGRNDAQYFWYCAWATEAAAADAPTQALANMERVESMELWKSLDWNGQVQFSTQLENAQAGDLEMVKEFLSLNCAFDELAARRNEPSDV